MAKSKYNLPNPKEPNEQQEAQSHIPNEPVGVSINLGILDILNTQTENYPEMIDLCMSNKFWTPADMLTSAGLNDIVLNLNNNSKLMSETYAYMDSINMLEIFHFQTLANTTIDSMLLSIITTRTNSLVNKNHNTSTVETDVYGPEFLNYDGSDKEQMSFKDFLVKNKPVVALYLFRLIMRFYSTDHELREKQAVMSRVR